MNEFEKYLLSCADVPYLAIYGTGLAAQLAYEGLNKLGIKVNCFCEKAHDIQEQYLGLPIKTEFELPKDSRCLICANPHYQIEKRLERCEIRDWSYIDPLICTEYAYDRDYFDKLKRKISANSEKLNELRTYLADEQSRHVLDIILEHRYNPKVEKTYGICIPQYFGNDLIEVVDDYNFVDCGSYNGDTLKRFVNQLKNPTEYFRKHLYHAFEADKNNIKEIEKYCKEKNIENVIIHQAAVWNGKERELFFERDDHEIAVAGRASTKKMSNRIRVKAESLDEILAGEQIDMITMDIEGAEPEALRGSENIIKEQAPILAISVYHQLEHIWEVPMQIKAYNSDYKIYLRHHRWNIADTVCYAIKK